MTYSTQVNVVAKLRSGRRSIELIRGRQTSSTTVHSMSRSISLAPIRSPVPARFGIAGRGGGW